MQILKKEADSSNLNNLKFARASFTAGFPGAPAGGSSAAEILEVVEKMKKGQDEEKKKEEGAISKEADAISQQQNDESQLAAQQQAAIQAQKKGIDREIKKISERIPGGIKILIALFIAIVYDIADLIIMLFSGGTSEAGEWVVDIIMNMFVFKFLMGDAWGKNKLRLIEFVPFLDVLPMYTISVIMAWRSLKKEKGEIKELKKEKRGLMGGTASAGPLGISPRGWSIMGLLLLISGPLGFLIFGIFGIIVVVASIVGIIILIMLENPDTRETAVTILTLLAITAAVGMLLIFAIAPLFTGYGGPLGTTMSNLAGVPMKVNEWWQNNNPVDTVRGYVKKQMAYATGDFYTGKVDENAKAQLGVFLEDMKQADPIFYNDRPVGIYAKLKVLTLDSPVNITIICKNSHASGVIPNIYPQSHFNVATYEEKDIDCVFPVGTIKTATSPTSTVTMGAEFNFKTMSYVKTYFMEIERLRSFRREELDPLDQYGITDKNPIAIYTNGPVGIGMGVGNPPVGIDTSQDSTMMTLGITIENKWDGKILGMNRMVVILPKQFTLEEIGVPFTQIDCDQLNPEEKGELCSNDFNNVYLVKDPQLEIAKNNFKSYRAFLKINKDNYADVLGLTPISTKFFKVTMDYRYRLEKTKTIEIKSRQTLAFDTSVVAGSQADITAPLVSEMKAEKIEGSDLIKVSWKTDEESNDVLVWWDPSKPGASSTPEATPGEVGFSKGHSRELSGVSKNKDYGVKITTADKNGNSASTTRTFRVS